MSSWFRFETSFRDHRKVRQLARRLGCSRVEARGYLVGLLCRVADESPDGCLSGWNYEDISDAADFDGDPDAFVGALCECGWIDQPEGEKAAEIHGFMERAESHKAALRARQYRARKASRDNHARVTSPSRDGHVTVMHASRHRHVDGRTDGRTDGQTDGRTDKTPLSSSSRDSSTESSKCEFESSILEVFVHYRVYHPRQHRKPNSRGKEWKAIRARLQEGYTVGDLCLAIDGCHLSPFHCGENERQRKYQSLELICRDASKVGQFLEIAKQTHPDAVLSERSQKSIRASQQWAERVGDA